MPIQTTCPACERGYTLPDSQRGKRVRCKNCQGTFVVGGEAADNGVTTADDEVPVLREVSDEEARRIRAENRLARGAGKLPAVVASANGAAGDEEEDRPARGAAPQKKSSMPLLLIGGGALLLLLLVCGGGGTGLAIWYFSSDDDKQASADDSQAEANPPVVNQGPFGNNAPKNPVKPKDNNPFKPPDNPFKPPDNPFRPGVPREDPYAPPTTVDKALAMLQDQDIRRRQVAADWLNNRAVDAARQKEVAAALEPLLDDGQTREHGSRALGKWATKDNVPALIKVLDYESGNAWQPAIDALARLKDGRAAAALATQLPNFFRKDAAGRALQAVGPAAEKDVVKYLHHKDFGARQKADQLIKGYNTKDDVLITQCVADVGATEVETKRLAAEDLAKIKPDASRKDEVARALDPLLTDTDLRVKHAAVNALAQGWAIADNALGLAKVLDDGGVRDKALATLVTLKPVENDQALALVAQHLQRPDRGKFSLALVQMAKPAKAEALALAVLGNPANDRFTREEAIGMLAHVGSKASIAPLQNVARAAAAQNDRTLAGKCLIAIKAIQARVGKK
jgi:HEAT repeat protein